jgi:capsular polysaccharide biosynthesis protein
MLNEDKLAERLADLAFEIIEPERLTTEEQIATFASADMVVGPSGSAMFNVVFCRPGTKLVDIESEPNWIYAHTGLFASCQLRYGLFVGRADPSDSRPVHRRWTVDIEPLMDCLSDFIRA